ncbi:protein kinase domain-containing protein [Streptomyces sp. NPDC004009]
MKWLRGRREETARAGEREAARLREDSEAAELAGRQGRAGDAAERYTALVAAGERLLGPQDTDTLALRHQLAHWTGEAGQPETAVRLFAALMADRERIQGPHHPDTELARHQLAHWHGRAGRPEEAVRRYESMRRSAERAGRTETALTLLCEVGYWQQKSGDNAAALRSFSEMLQTAQQELGPGHQLVTVARQRYAEVAGRLPFGSEGGDDGLRDLLATAAAVEAAGDSPRACRMYAEAATRSEQLYGAGSAQALSAYVAQARAAARAEDHTTAADCFGKVLACMEGQGRGPGTPEYDALRAHRDQLVRTTRRTVVRVAQGVAELLGDQTQAAPDAACVILARENGAPYANCLAVVNDVPDDVSWREGTPEQWAEVLADLAGQDWEATALCFARADPRPAPEEAALCERFGLPGVVMSRLDEERVQMQAYVFRDGEAQAAAFVVVDEGEGTREDGRNPAGTADERAGGRDEPESAVQTDEPEPAGVAEESEPEPAGVAEESRLPGAATAPIPPGDRIALHPQAEAIGSWRRPERARPADGLERPGAFGPYEVLERVGEGGFGRVYLCQDPDGLMVAVKTLHAHLAAAPTIRRGFAHEVRAAQRVGGRFTVPVIAADTDGPVPWMAVPYVAAPSLQELTVRCGPLDDDLVRVLGAGIAVALSAIHAEGIVHLDLKPANVLLTEDGPRVIDFGIAQIERITEPRRGFTGTYAYASPEQLREQRSFTPASDIFSLGTLIARLVLGRSPWGRDTPTVVAAIRSGTPDLVGLPEDLAAVVRSCLHPEPGRRPAASDVAEALVPGAGHGKIKAPALSEEARALVTERATRPHTTLPYTRARRSSADSTHHPTTG